jgi:hypothetical protein
MDINPGAIAVITVSILINGNPIFTRSAVRTVTRERGHPCEYKTDDGTVISHVYEDGAVVLAKKLLDTIKEPRRE